MNTKTSLVLLFAFILPMAPLTTSTAFAETVVPIKIDEDRRCEKLTISDKRYPGGIGSSRRNPDSYNVENVLIQRGGIVKYTYNEKKGIICFQPQRIGSTRVRVFGTMYALDNYGRLAWNKRFYRSFKVRVRP